MVPTEAYIAENAENIEAESGLLSNYRHVREQSLALTAGLSDEDMLLQSMPDASPTKWHLAHTTWFFDTFLLQPWLEGYQPFDHRYAFLFNSYYETVGERHPRPQRGLLSRPPLKDVLAYRHYVDAAMEALIARSEARLKETVTIGLHHEMQHQELILTDIKHALSANHSAFPVQSAAPEKQAPADRQFSYFQGGLTWIGANAHDGFAYDCEQPRHQVFVPDFSLRNSPVTNSEWQEFIEDGGYDRPEFWLSDGWARSRREDWQAPLYWRKLDGRWQMLTLHGYRFLDPEAPVCHLSYYEADAFARWAGCRLPTEFEWEYAAREYPVAGNFAETGAWHPQAGPRVDGLKQLYGDVWEWTQSAFTPYPGFRAPDGALAEYNGKFMVNQWVLRGGSCATPRQQVRSTYRNFFYPHQRWQFSGLRLAK